MKPGERMFPESLVSIEKSPCGKGLPRAWHCFARTTGKPEADSPPPDSGLIGLLVLKSSGAEQESSKIVL
jgi:hypothetical protein